MNPKIIFLSICLTFFLGNTGFTQERVVKGKVTSFRTIPLNEALISIKGMDREILTDSTGSFSFTCDEKDKLTISAHGFYPQKIKLADFAAEDSLKVDLRLKNGKKNFEYATGYGHISAERLSYAIEHMESNPDFSNYNNILEILEGRVSGISISANSINIRGTATLNEGLVPALLVVDGTIVDYPVFTNIPPEQVKSIDVLKGASASARYGSRGMGGVIVVTTKTEN
jgi:TonB-dependent SusC/RagA subfamily outer membrane receptor